MVGTTVIFEQPGSELLRTCLRLEHLFAQLDYHYQHYASIYHVRNTVRFLIEIINALDRPDLKSKLTQEFHRVYSAFNKLESTPHISQEQLDKTRQQLKYSLDYLTSIYGKLAQNLRQNHFLNNIQTHLKASGGDTPFETPAYHCWLQKPRQEQQNDLTQWLEELTPVRRSIQLLLQIIRESTDFQTAQAQQGFYHCALPSYPVSVQLVQIEMATESYVFPEISLGKHRLNVCFYELATHQRPQQINSDLSFQLALCKI